MVEKGKVRIGYGPPENRWRPSIDVLFRSAAATYGSQVTGIILTGLLNDGVSGMWAIKRCKGTVIVQDPREAEYPDMPLSVLNNMEVDYSVSASKMGEVLEEVFQSKVFNEVAIPQDVVSEAEIAAKMATGIEEARPLGDQSVYTCPDCGGLLWEIKGGAVTKYRCHTGHSYTEEDLIIKQSENVENTLWVALRMMEERRNLLKRMEQQTRERGFSRFANDHFAKAAELERHIGRLKELLKIVHDHNDT
jgi:two-component system chemotaxis response regulator CheB